jgi:hypothetical protein
MESKGFPVVPTRAYPGVLADLITVSRGLPVTPARAYLPVLATSITASPVAATSRAVPSSLPASRQFPSIPVGEFPPIRRTRGFPVVGFPWIPASVFHRYSAGDPWIPAMESMSAIPAKGFLLVEWQPRPSLPAASNPRPDRSAVTGFRSIRVTASPAVLLAIAVVASMSAANRSGSGFPKSRQGSVSNRRRPLSRKRAKFAG